MFFAVFCVIFSIVLQFFKKFIDFVIISAFLQKKVDDDVCIIKNVPTIFFDAFVGVVGEKNFLFEFFFDFVVQSPEVQCRIACSHDDKITINLFVANIVDGDVFRFALRERAFNRL